MQDSFDVTTIIFLALAVFVIWRLRSVLGQKTGHEQNPADAFRREPPPPRGGPMRPAEADNVVRLPGAQGNRATISEASPDRWKGIAAAGSPVAAGLDEIVRQEPSFDARTFVSGAKMAYEMIVTAFASGDRKTLQGLLSKEVYEGFEQAIAERERRGERAETTFVSIDRAEIVGVDVRNRVAQVTVRFASQLISATRDAAGKVVDGSPETVADVTDVWTFARTLGSRDPNWPLVATEAGQ
ncbi:Tim44/TimA family putative adaptor protein [Salinarimonas soli]|uniref:Tim44 domain-containing protein n=1 Tax=Salinarimonas soli TaxID=1638099 RepID=A0A5B2VG48_9HYPH|nr:Tim44/TimA family putative adaptor protein [Salinarimonas soli]KAA2237865.1 Tim44 domain-containing protein [Salinarimonas soli]